VLNKAFTYLQCYGIDKDMEALKDTLLKRLGEIQAVSDAVDYLKVKEKIAVFFIWIWPLRDAIEEVEDALDTIDYYELERATRSQKGSHKVHHSVSKFVKGEHVRFANAASRICMMRLRKALLSLDEVVTDAYFFIDSQHIGVPQYSHDTSDTSENSHGPIDTLVIGRENEKERVIFWLTQPESVSIAHGVSVFAVHGKAGMGKTVLAQLVYTDKEVMEAFDLMAWLHVPMNFDAETMTRLILESVTNRPFSLDTLEQLQHTLITELRAKKYFLILDDACDGDKIDEWKKFVDPLRWGRIGSKILLTTRELSTANIVAKLIGAEPELLLLGGLSYDDSMMLFRSRYAFSGDMSQATFEENISHIVKSTVQKFEGCPLLTKALSGYLGANIFSKHLNETIRSMGDDEYSANTSWLLKLCYDGLPAHLQACFRYCSLFLRGHRFNKEELVKFWMGSGLILEDLDSQLRLEDIGHDYVDTLVRRSFLDKIVGENYYVVPSAMHELAQFFSLGECARAEACELERVNKNVRHLCIAQHEFLTPEKLRVISCFKYLRTLIIEGGLRDQKTENILEKILRDLKCLRLLSLPRTFSSSYLDEVLNLVHLRYISLFKCSGSDLYKVFRLYNLQVLKFYHLSAQVNDFEDIIGLHHLRYLDVPENCYPKITQIGSLSKLQGLDRFSISKREGCGLFLLENLVSIRRLGLYEMENTAGYLDAAKLRLNHKTQLRSLSFTWGTCSTDNIDDKILNNLEPPRGIEELHIRFYTGHVPIWMVNESLSKLVVLVIKGCARWERIPSLATLHFLKHLRLEHLSQLRCISQDFESICFPPFLETLTVKMCTKLKRLPDLPLSLNKLVLEFVGLEVFPKLDLSFAISQPNRSSPSTVQSKLVCLYVENCSYLVALNEGMLQQQEHLGSLQELVIKHCENLKHLPSKGFSAQVQLKYPKIVSCPLLRMRRDSEDGLFPVSLKYFDISCCGDAEVPLLTSLQRLINLRRLSLFDCNNLKSLPSEKIFKLLGVVHEISIARCRNLISLGGLGAVGSLRQLTIIGCEKLSLEYYLVDDKSKEDVVGCSFELDRLKIDHPNILLVKPLINPMSIKELHICNGVGQTYLPKNWLLKNCASLRSIVIEAANSALSLPSLLKELERLQILQIERASLIQSIPEMCISLIKLTIRGCHPLLLMRLQKDTGP
jgi:hypothetical protein